METNIVREIIDNSFKNNKVSHAYLVSSITSPIAAEYLIKKIVETDGDVERHSNVFVINAEDGLISKERVQTYLRTFSQKSSRNRVLLIKDIELASKQALNSLLKFIEEPTENVYIVMTTKNYLRVLPTIVSRSQLLLDFQVTDSDMSATTEFSILFKRIFRMKSLFEEQDKELLISIARELIEALEQAMSNKYYLYISLNKLLTKDNIDIVIKMLIEFYNDVWRTEEGIPLSFEDYSNVVHLYNSIGFNFKDAIALLSEVLNDKRKSLNFKLYKANLLIKIGDLYE